MFIAYPRAGGTQLELVPEFNDAWDSLRYIVDLGFIGKKVSPDLSVELLDALSWEEALGAAIFTFFFCWCVVMLVVLPHLHLHLRLRLHPHLHLHLRLHPHLHLHPHTYRTTHV